MLFTMKKKILNGFIKFIKLTDRARNALVNDSKLKSYVSKIALVSQILYFFSFIIFFFVIIKFDDLSSFFQWILVIPMSIWFLASKAFKDFTLLSTKLIHFMGYGSLYTVIIFIITLVFNPKILSRSTLELFVQDFEIVNSMLIPTLVATLFWSLCSCFATTKIAITGNAILTGFITLLREIALYASAFYDYSPKISAKMEENMSTVELELYSLIYQEKMASTVDSAINTFALPAITVLGVATIVSLIKDYVEAEYMTPKDDIGGK